MIEDIFADLEVDEEKKAKLRKQHQRKHKKTDYKHSKSSLKSEILIADRINKYQDPIEHYNPSTMLHALRAFRSNALMKKNIDVEDLGFHHKGIILDGDLVNRLVTFWKDLPENFESQVKATNLNTRIDSLVDAFDKVRIRTTALLPNPITLNVLIEGKERLTELQEITRNRYSDKTPKDVDQETFKIKDSFEDRLNKFALQLKEQANNSGYISWNEIFDPNSLFETRITNAHYLSFLTFSDKLRFVNNKFIFV